MSKAKKGIRDLINEAIGTAKMVSKRAALQVNIRTDPCRRIAHEIAMADPDRKPSTVKVFSAEERQAYARELAARGRS